MMRSPACTYGLLLGHALIGLQDGAPIDPELLGDPQQRLTLLDLIADKPVVGARCPGRVARASLPGLRRRRRPSHGRAGVGPGSGVAPAPAPAEDRGAGETASVDTGAAPSPAQLPMRSANRTMSEDPADTGGCDERRSTTLAGCRPERDRYLFATRRGHDTGKVSGRHSARRGDLLGVLVHLAAGVPFRQAEALLECQWQRSGRILGGAAVAGISLTRAVGAILRSQVRTYARQPILLRGRHRRGREWLARWFMLDGLGRWRSVAVRYADGLLGRVNLGRRLALDRKSLLARLLRDHGLRSLGRLGLRHGWLAGRRGTARGWSTRPGYRTRGARHPGRRRRRPASSEAGPKVGLASGAADRAGITGSSGAGTAGCRVGWDRW